MKKILSILLVMALMLSLVPLSFAADDTVTITLLHTNDVHARVVGSETAIGYARIATLLRDFKEKNRNTLLIDAGDALHGQTIATISRGLPIVELMNAVGYDIMAAGNHDFNYGFERLLELESKMNFRLLSSNVRYEFNDNPVMRSMSIRTIGGVKVAFFGLTTPETAYKTNPMNVVGIKFEDPIVSARRVVNYVKDRVDVIVCVAHLGVDKETEITSRDVLKAVPEIDVMIDGHSHTAIEKGEMIGNSLLAQAGQYSENIGVVEITVKGSEVVGKTARLIPASEVKNVQPDKAILAKIDEINEANKVITGIFVTSVSEELDGKREHVRTGETNLGNLITNAMLADTKADIAITNGGGIRASIPAGDVTVGDVITVLPFGNYIVTLEMTGQAIMEALENGITDYPGAKGGFPHVAGMVFSFDPSKPAGERLVSVMINGEPLLLEKVYKVATNDFLASGGDKYTSMLASKKVGESIALDEAVVNYMRMENFVVPKVEGRVIVKEATSTTIEEGK